MMKACKYKCEMDINSFKELFVIYKLKATYIKTGLGHCRHCIQDGGTTMVIQSSMHFCVLLLDYFRVYVNASVSLFTHRLIYSYYSNIFLIY